MQLLALESYMITGFIVYFFIVFRKEKPPSVPSAAAIVTHDDITKGMWTDTKVLLRNTNFMLVLTIFMLIYTIFAALGFVINPLFVPFGYNTT